jgi:uncharacterized membrane protein
MKRFCFVFGAKQVLVLLGAVVIALLQVYYGTRTIGASRLAIVAVPYLGLLIVYFLMLAWQSAKALDQEVSSELETVLSRSSEVFADLVLAWLTEAVDPRARFTLEEVSEETGLSEFCALQGLMLLGNKYGVVRETLLYQAWEYSANGPVRLKSRFRLKENSSS